jgi:hypothetical protein
MRRLLITFDTTNLHPGRIADLSREAAALGKTYGASMSGTSLTSPAGLRIAMVPATSSAQTIAPPSEAGPVEISDLFALRRTRRASRTFRTLAAAMKAAGRIPGTTIADRWHLRSGASGAIWWNATRMVTDARGKTVARIINLSAAPPEAAPVVDTKTITTRVRRMLDHGRGIAAILASEPNSPTASALRAMLRSVHGGSNQHQTAGVSGKDHQ